MRYSVFVDRAERTINNCNTEQRGNVAIANAILALAAAIEGGFDKLAIALKDETRGTQREEYIEKT